MEYNKIRSFSIQFKTLAMGQAILGILYSFGYDLCLTGVNSFGGGMIHDMIKGGSLGFTQEHSCICYDLKNPDDVSYWGKCFQAETELLAFIDYIAEPSYKEISLQNRLIARIKESHTKIGTMWIDNDDILKLAEEIKKN